MIYNLLPLVAKNSKFFDTCKVFDIGKVWTKLKVPTNVALDERYATHHFCEEMQLGAFRYEKSVSNRKEDPLLKMKSMILSLMKHLGIQ